MSETPAPTASPTLVGRIRSSLSAKLLLLTVFFVLLVEVVLLIPSISKQRVAWLQARIEAAYLVGLALEAPEAEMIEPQVADQLFATANILGVTVNRGGANIQIFAPDVDPASPPTMRYIDLRSSSIFDNIADAWGSMVSRGDNMVRVIGVPAYSRDGAVDIIISQRALRDDLYIYARNVLALSLLISTVTAWLVYWALNRMTVKPVRALTRGMTAFQNNPEDPRNIVEPSLRTDEIGVAERSLHALELRIHDLLSQRRRLAALGAGISKLSHDLRNILASAQLMSDRLAKSEDPRVRKLSPRLIQALDRAIALSRDTLSYARMEPGTLSKSRFSLHALVDEVFEDTASMRVTFINETPDTLDIVADRNQLYRALFNLVRNAVEAMTPDGDEMRPGDADANRVTISARADAAQVIVEIADTGPGVPPEARTRLFEPFHGSMKPGGSGLGVAIVYEIMYAHGGGIELKSSSDRGAVFALSLPSA
jgi:signal transduction histidine kinase